MKRGKIQCVIGCVERILFIVYTERGNDIYKVSIKKTSVSLRIDTDVLMALKDMGKGYQTRINNILRKAVFG
ncbi:BrnA antitoxin family protein [Treponema vincentii]|uniref:BrnA antitoxin family protein n=1 Tax=Treponema vincentii TaxID=69710 RepID=UPI0009E4684D